jgi:hypothetical protein
MELFFPYLSLSLLEISLSFYMSGKSSIKISFPSNQTKPNQVLGRK